MNRRSMLALAVALGMAAPTLFPTAARAGGPNAARVDTLKANHYLTYSFVFRGGERAQVLVLGDGDTDLDLYIYDEHGNLIASDDDPTDNCLVTWVPAWTGKFTVKLVNRGTVSNRFALRTN